MYRNLVRVLGLCVALDAGRVAALGLGDMELNSAVNEALNAEIKLLNVGNLNASQIIVKLASADDFQRADVERDFFLSNFEYEVKLNQRGGPVIHVSTDELVKEPYLNFLLEVKWPSGKLIREYTLLLDLPTFSSNAPAASTQQTRAAAAQPVRTTPPASTTNTRGGNDSGARAVPTQAYTGETWTVKGSDTLWSIAKTVRPSAQVSMKQTMLAIQQKNPQAFGSNNINILRTGQVLRIPTEQDVYNVQRGDADVEVARQMQAWRGDELPQLDARVSKRNTAAASATSDGRLKLSSASGAGLDGAVDGDGDGDQEKALLNARLEEVIAALEIEAERNNELSANVDGLRAEMQDLRSKLKLRNQQLAKLQAGGKLEDLDLADLGEALAQDNESLPFEVAPGEGDTNKSSEEDELLAQTPPPAKTPPKTPGGKDKPQGSAFAPEDPTWLDQLMTPPVLAGAAGILALLGGGLFMRSRRSSGKNAEQWHAGVEPELDEEIDINDPHRMANDPENQKGARYGFAQDDSLEAEIGDPIAESDIYMAYGRYPQAVELLERALRQEPDRVDLHQKLAEVYAAAGDEAGAAAQQEKLARMGVVGAAAAPAANSLSDIEDDYEASAAPDVMEEFKQTLPEEERQLLESDADEGIEALLADEGGDFDSESLLSSEAELGDMAAVENLLQSEGEDSFNEAALDIDLDLDAPTGEDALSALLGEAEIPDLEEPVLDEGTDFGADLDFSSIESDGESLLDAADIELDGLEAADDSAFALDDLSDEAETAKSDDNHGLQLDDDMASELLEAGILDEDFPSLDESDLDLSAEFADVDASLSLEGADADAEALTAESQDEAASDAFSLDDDLGLLGEASEAEGDDDLVLGLAEESLSDELLSDDSLSEQLLGEEPLSEVLNSETLNSEELLADQPVDTEDPFVDNVQETLAEIEELASQEPTADLMDVSSLNVADAENDGEYTLTAEDLEIDIDSELAQLDSGLIDGLGLDEPEAAASAAEQDEKPGLLDGLSLADAVEGSGSTDLPDLPEMDVVSELDDASLAVSAASFDTDSEQVDGEGPLGLDLSIFEDDLRDSAGDANDDLRASDVAKLDVDETATKLDLARAYIDMGDTQSAQEMLDEVMHEGSPQDKAQAQALQDKLS